MKPLNRFDEPERLVAVLVSILVDYARDIGLNDAGLAKQCMRHIRKLTEDDLVTALTPHDFSAIKGVFDLIEAALADGPPQ